MDERLEGCGFSYPIPENDMKLRLSIKRYVSPVIMDSGTVYRINDIFMDVTDQPYLRRHLTSTGAILSLCGMAFSVYLWMLPDTLDDPGMGLAYEIFKIAAVIFLVIFGIMAVWSGRDELFALKRRPVRFNRVLGRIYAVRRRRFFDRRRKGDVVWEIPWGEETVFCVSEGKDGWGKYYHIKCYVTDEDKNVVRAIAIGRRWEYYELANLLAQWNYWCKYMNDGTDGLPPPMLYLAENESLIETFFICMYTFGLAAPAVVRLIGIPFMLPSLICKRLSLATCRQPQWPADIEQANAVFLSKVDEPKGTTPIGWKATIKARHRGAWPDNPHLAVADWMGADAETNAKFWAEKTAS